MLIFAFLRFDISWITFILKNVSLKKKGRFCALQSVLAFSSVKSCCVLFSVIFYLWLNTLCLTFPQAFLPVFLPVGKEESERITPCSRQVQSMKCSCYKSKLLLGYYILKLVFFFKPIIIIIVWNLFTILLIACRAWQAIKIVTKSHAKLLCSTKRDAVVRKF